jgi:hypothetical protein
MKAGSRNPILKLIIYSLGFVVLGSGC